MSSSTPGPPTPPDPLQMGLFSTERVSHDTCTRFLLLLYSPIGSVVFILRLFLGLQTFLVACLLRKTALLRGVVLRVMSGLLGIVTLQKGSREPSTRMIVCNHVSCLDHMAVDLLSPCLLPSVWDIPNLLRWLFGYADLGAHSGRSELVRQSKEYVQGGGLPLMALPEGAMTNGKKALLKFSTWPFEVTDRVQPGTIRIWRPLIGVESTVLGAPWWQDTLWFLFLPFTFVTVKWLPVMEREDSESLEAFSERVARSIGNDLGIEYSEVTSTDAVNVARKYVQQRRITSAASSAPRQRKVPLDPKKMDEVAMRIKQSHPSIRLIDIRRDLDKTKDMQTTIQRLKGGLIVSTPTSSSKRDISSNPSEWRKHFEERKWSMIEENRSKFLQRMMSSGDH